MMPAHRTVFCTEFLHFFFFLLELQILFVLTSGLCIHRLIKSGIYVSLCDQLLARVC